MAVAPVDRSYTIEIRQFFAKLGGTAIYINIRPNTQVVLGFFIGDFYDKRID